MIFKQLFEKVSSTYTYLIGCEETGGAVLVDPVLPTWQRDLSVINELGLRLTMTVETHIHADHVTSALFLKREVGSQIAGPALDGLPCTDVGLTDGVPFRVGKTVIVPIHTPGHTDHHMAYRLEDRVLTGDALLIDGCGRTDFQNGDASALFDSVVNKLFVLPDETLVYPAHDYRGRYVSSIAQEKKRNLRLGQGKKVEEFIQIMAHLDLSYPKFIDYAVPGNRACGQCPNDLPAYLKEYCGSMAKSPQG